MAFWERECCGVPSIPAWHRNKLKGWTCPACKGWTPNRKFPAKGKPKGQSWKRILEPASVMAKKPKVEKPEVKRDPKGDGVLVGRAKRLKENIDKRAKEGWYALTVTYIKPGKHFEDTSWEIFTEDSEPQPNLQMYAMEHLRDRLKLFDEGEL